MLELADLSRTIIGLGIVLLLMAGVFWLMRRFGPAGTRSRFTADRRLAVLESLPLDPRTRLVLVRHDHQEHLLLVATQGGGSLLATTGDPAGHPVLSAGEVPRCAP